MKTPLPGEGPNHTFSGIKRPRAVITTEGDTASSAIEAGP
jgi:hypothetical protein